MTLIVSLEGMNEVVVAADSLAHDGSNEGYYNFKMTKLRQLGQKWVFGAAGTSIGYDLYKYINSEARPLNGNIHIAVHDYARRMRELYEKHEYAGEAFMLLAGVQDGQAATYTWALERDNEGRLKFVPPVSRPPFTAIGANNHGALYLLNSYHSSGMDTTQRIFIAYHAVREVTKHDPRVGEPVEIAIVRDGGCRFLSQEDLEKVKKASQELSVHIRQRFDARGPGIPGL